MAIKPIGSDGQASPDDFEEISSRIFPGSPGLQKEFLSFMAANAGQVGMQAQAANLQRRADGIAAYQGTGAVSFNVANGGQLQQGMTSPPHARTVQSGSGYSVPLREIKNMRIRVDGHERSGDEVESTLRRGMKSHPALT